MNQYHNLQMRFSADSIAPGADIFFQGKKYLLGQSVPKSLQPRNLPIGVVMNGYTEQFQLLQNGQPIGAAWFYFYGSMEDTRWAVLDAVELSTAAVA